MLASLALACGGEASHVSSDLVFKHSQATGTGQLRPGWTLVWVGREIDDVTQIVHRVRVIPEYAGEILLLSGSQRRELVGEVACPKADAAIWQELESSQDVVIQLETERGSFAEVSCRRAIRP